MNLTLNHRQPQMVAGLSVIALKRVLLVSLMAPLLCANQIPEGRAGLELAVHRLTLEVEHQIEEIAGLIPPDQVDRLRDEHYAWKLHRDIYCADAGRNSVNDLREFECLIELTSEYFDRREREISGLARAVQQRTQSDRPPPVGIP